MTILEFNEKSQCFHNNNIVDNVPKNPENSFGYKTLVICKNHQEAVSIADFLQKQFMENGSVGKFDELKRTVDNLICFISDWKEVK